eukprot:CAMPEP_0178866086 /NCGR_PEP_ID=MMETSP0747-20121128/4765_1 /TAXON_ID=913974 /ORGANISM="Nitzschia punctata, Strain CCMP561" /LENGTH=935 /DNA_ID=CAMNT_0020532935 /DNA_START=70 /DNA_END=2877 /DNA_ORIENTATION=-
MGSRYLFAFACALASHPGAGMTSESAAYRVRAVSNQHRTLQDPFLTFSNDGAVREDEFYLDLFETPGELSDENESKNAIQTAMNFFLLSELSGQFREIDSIESVTSEILSLGARNDTVSDPTTGQETTRIGTEVKMRVFLTFDQKPSPEAEEVHIAMIQVMSNLTDFVTYLTSSLTQAEGEHELSGVYEAIRRELPLPALQVPPNTTIAESNPGENEIQIIPQDQPNVASAAVPVVLLFAFIVAIVVFLVFRRRGKTEPETPKKTPVVYMDVENDMYSMDRSVETSQSPANILSPYQEESGNSIQYSMSDSEGDSRTANDDSIFSGVDTEYRNVQPTKSVLTGFTHASAATQRVSNIERKKNVTTNQKSYGANNSLFAFSEEADEVQDEARDDKDNSIVDETPSLTRSELSEDSDELEFSQGKEQGRAKSVAKSPARTEASGGKRAAGRDHDDQQLFSTKKTESSEVAPKHPWACGATPGSTTQVLADLENLETNTRRDPTPTMGSSNVEAASSNGSVAYNSLFSCTGPVMSDSAMLGKSLQEAPTPLQRNGSDKLSYSDGAGKSANFMSGLFKSLSNHSSPQKNSQSEGANSEPGSPNRHVGGHWLTSSNNGQRKRPTSPKNDSGDDYDMNLSRPSTPGDGGSVSDSLQLSDYAKEDSYGYLPGYAKMVDQGPTDQPYSSHSRSRRHVGDMIGGDGSAMYQTNAMHPLDWSYKSGEVGSVGESTISETDQTSSNAQNQYIFKSKDDMQLSPDHNDNSKTVKSESTKESNASSRASASRQLINDLVWLEKKIAGVRQGSALGGHPGIEGTDSLSYVSNDNDEFQSVASNDDSQDEDTPTVSTGQTNSVMSSIVCRDCYAPPGKLHIVIHSTKDGPAVHTVKAGSSLEGHIFPGDLIISVDNIDTRSFTAEQVMKMMASKSDKERKITVLHFEEEE